MPSVDGLCPACKMPLVDHLASRRYLPAEVPPGKIAVVNGRCIVAGQRAPQKGCWVPLREPMTPQEYRRRFEAKTIPLEPCPWCKGRLVPWGSFPRTLAEGEPPELQELRLLRGLCQDRDCPMCTVTHYPSFITPYHPVPTAQREAVVRARAQGASWLTLTAQVARTTARRWCEAVEARATEVWLGLTTVRNRLDPQAPAPPGKAEACGPNLPAMFEVCDAVGAMLARAEGWVEELPALAIPRLFQPPAPTTLPVWT